jgi:hypothetical protein
MKTIKLLVELTYNGDTMHGDDADGIVWFNDEILGNDLIAWSNELGDEVGIINVLEIL